MALKTVDGLLAPASEWRVGGWALADGGATVEGTDSVPLSSPKLRLEPGVLNVFLADVEVEGEGTFEFGLQPLTGKGWFTSRTYRGTGRQRFAVTYNPLCETVCMLSLHITTGDGKAVTLRSFDVSMLRPERTPAPAVSEADTMLAHWGPIRRWIHRRCRQSARVNGIVAAVEMRLGREELLSLP
jgi:hypothetical protein